MKTLLSFLGIAVMLSGSAARGHKCEGAPAVHTVQPGARFLDYQH